MWRHGGLVVSALNSGSSGPGSSPGQGHCAAFLGKTILIIFFHSIASLHLDVCTSDFNGGGSPVMDWHPIQKGVEIFLVTSCYRNWDELQSDWPFGLN